jgi:glycosyltransferase involved in cell wall biosynthesis
VAALETDKPCGSLDLISPLRVAGWAWNHKAPKTRVSVQFIDENDQVFAQINAGAFREDLREVGIGDGFHAFDFMPFGIGEQMLRPGIRARILETGALLPIAPDAFTMPDRLPQPFSDHSEIAFLTRAQREYAQPTITDDLQPVIQALDSIYNVLQGTFPDVALTLNNQRNRVLPFVPTEFDVLFLVGLVEGESKRYRVFNVQAALEDAGYKSGIYYDFDIQQILLARPKFKALVVFRAPLVGPYQQLLTYARSISARVIWDIDDLVFDVRVIPQMDGLKYLSPEARIKNAEGMRLYKAFLQAADVVTTTTHYLAERISEFGASAFVIPNTLSAEQISFAQSHDGVDVRLNNTVTIGFFSGTKTHDLDFQECRSALIRVLQENANARFIVVGHFDIENDDGFAQFGSRIEKIEFVPYLKMLDLLRYIDIIIVPLEHISYCEGKSELKFFEAALVGCVAVCSATDTYKRAIIDGESGFLCQNEEQWYRSLSVLCASPALRREVGAKAKAIVLNKYLTSVYVPVIEEAYGLQRTRQEAILAEAMVKTQRYGGRTEGKLGTRLRGAFLLPDLLIGGGGHRKAIMFASALEAAGFDIELMFVNSTRNAQELSDIINGNYTTIIGKIRLFAGSLSEYDWIVATSWTTAAIIVEHGIDPNKVIYLIQDFEPFFYAMGSDYIKAEATYLAGFHMIAYGPWIHSHLKTQFGKNPGLVPFSLDKRIYFHRGGERLDRIAVFAKPEMARRCFELVAEGLRVFHRLRPKTEIVLFGSDKTKALELGFPFTDLGVVTELGRLADLYRSCQCGIAISTTNPSIVGYEMLSSGCPVVDIDRPDLILNYGSPGMGVIPVRPFARDFGFSLATEMADKEKMRLHQDSAINLVATMPSDDDVCAIFVSFVRSVVDRISASHTALTAESSL